jgi:hypothetical protein
MPIKEPVYKSQLSGAVDSFLHEKRRKITEKAGLAEGDVEFLDIISFIERFKLLPYGLYPVQKFIVKLYYNIPLDNSEKIIKVTDRFGGKVLHEFTEVEYLAYLYDHGRCNVREQDGVERHELVLVLGRRSGKSSLSAIFAAYELYKLICRGHPQAYYGMPSGSEIRLFCIANDKEQASIVYGDMQAHIEAVDYFKGAVAHNTQTFMRFRTENDRKKFGNGGKSTLVASFKSSIARGLRGRGVICSILDEIAFFVNDGKSSAEQIYRAMNPSLAQFSPKDPKNRQRPIGPSEGRMILISSPDAREGFFFRQYQLAMSKDRGSTDMLMVQAPTWEVNPTLDQSYYEKEYFKDPRGFMTEHGAEFSDRVRGWIDDFKDLTDCIDPELRPKTRSNPREIHLAGVDFGLSKDGTAIALTKLVNGKIELAYHEVWYPKKSWKESNPHLSSPIIPYCMDLQNVQRLDIDAIADWFTALSRRFFIHKGVFDQWAGPVFEQVLHKRGLKQFEMRNFLNSDSSQMYNTLRMFILNRQLRLYDWPLPEGGESGVLHSPLIQELLELQATSGGKNIILVEAPKVAGKHDDQSDALARSVLLAAEYMRLNPTSLITRNVELQTPMNRSLQGYNNYHRVRARMHGVVRERMVPRISGR